MPARSEEQLRTHPIVADAPRPPCLPRAAASARPWRAQVGDADARKGGSQPNEPTSSTASCLSYPLTKYVGISGGFSAVGQTLLFESCWQTLQHRWEMWHDAAEGQPKDVLQRGTSKAPGLATIHI